VLVYIVYVSVIGLAVQRIVSAPLPAELGGTNPFAHVLMMGGVAVVALLLLHHIRADLSARPPGPGLFRQATSVAVGMGMTAAFGAAGSAAVAGARKVGPRSGSGGELTPWERLDAEAKMAAAVHGAPQPGFEQVPGGGGAVGAGWLGEPVALAAMGGGRGAGVESPRRRGRPPARPSATKPPDVWPPNDTDPPALPAMADTRYHGPVPLPEPRPESEPPPADEPPAISPGPQP
jgi:hypothetical protein